MGIVRDLIYKISLKISPIDMDEIYQDQARRSVVFGDRRITSFYLPLGIQQLDGEYSQRIMNIHESKENPKKLKEEIKSNPHLHRKIKRNLLYNLANRL